MITGTAKLIVDLGNSETRVMTIFGKNSKGVTKKKLHSLDNRFSQVSEDRLKVVLESGEYTDENSSIFNYNGQTYCVGEIAEREFNQVSFRPTALEKKYESFPTIMALQNAFRQGYDDLCVMTNSGYDSLDVAWNVYVMLPPEDIDIGAAPMAERVKSIKSISFSMPELKKDLTIEKVNILPEGFCAFIGVMFESKGKLREGYKYLATSTDDTLICDIGAGTTDFVLVHGSQVVSSSRFTREIGGNNVHRLVQRMLRGQRLSLPDHIVQAGCQTGRVYSGAREVDISEFISEAKRQVSRQLVEAVQEFFESSMLPIHTISNLLVVGGGAEQPKNESIAPISNYIVEYMKALSPDIRLIELPMVETDEGTEKISARLLNITGAGIIAE